MLKPIYYKYAEQMRKKYCPQALIIFMHNQPKNVIGVLLKKYRVIDFNALKMRGYFETFFDKLIKYKDKGNHLQIVPYQPQTSYSDMVSSALGAAGGYVGSFFYSDNTEDAVFGNENIIRSRGRSRGRSRNKTRNTNPIRDKDHLGSLNLDRLLTLEPDKEEVDIGYRGPANIINLFNIMKYINFDRNADIDNCKK